jgi:general nucleoside transport system ATP-binding protein
MAATAIRLKGITKRFPGTVANDSIDLTIEPGTVHALLGENGAGKTTLMNVLSGRYRADDGEISVAGRAVQFRSPKDALRSGIGMVHQHFMLVGSHTVADNVALGLDAPRFLLRRGRMEDEVRRLSEAYRLPIDPRARIDELSLGQQQRVEILKLLHRSADLLILDEPTAVLTPGEVEGLFATLRRIAHEGRSVVFITHKLEEVMEIADRITVLRRGRRVADLTPGEVDSRRELARLMVGREVVLGVEREPVPLGDPVLELRDCSGEDARGHRAFRRVSFALRRGEILSIVGVAGNGQREVVAAITGGGRLSSGQMLLFGKPLAPAGRAALDAVGYIPEDRTGTGSAAGLDLTDNLLLTTYRRFCRWGWLKKKAAGRVTEDVLARFHVAAPGPHTLGRQLSGGNLQKLILARELSKDPRLLIAEHPTHGLDIGATVEVWEELLRQRARAGILLVSGDLTEVLALSDRIAVIFRGELMGTFSAADADAVAEIGPMMAGVLHE